MAWVDANATQLTKLGKKSPDDFARVEKASQDHIAFLRKTDPISTGKPKDAMPVFAADYTGWVEWALKKIAASDDLDAIFESIDPFWSDLMPPDKDALQAARRAREEKLEP
jgi:hypothetical protein